MTIYYKGILALKKSIKLKKINFYTGTILRSGSDIERVDDISFRFGRFGELTFDDKKEFFKNFNSLRFPDNGYEETIVAQNNTAMMDILFKIINPKFKTIRKIMYEKVLDTNGNAYAREIQTGFLFPILSSNDLEYILRLFKTEDWMDAKILKGSLLYQFKERSNFALCNCYCTDEKVADYNEVEAYKNKNLNHASHQKMKTLFQMNVFDDSCIMVKNNTQSLINSLNSTSTINGTNTVNLTAGNNNILVQESQNSSHESLKALQEVKKILDSLSDEDLALLRDISQNNLSNINIDEYMKMTKEEKLALLRKQETLDDDRPKVCLKKKN